MEGINEKYSKELIGKRDVKNASQTNRINHLTFIDRYGKKRQEVRPTYKLTQHLINKKPINFGSIADYNLKTDVSKRLKNPIEVKTYEDEGKLFKDKHMISRRFASNVVQFWSYLSKNVSSYYQKTGRTDALSKLCEKRKCEKDYIKNKTIITFADTGHISLKDIKVKRKDPYIYMFDCRELIPILQALLDAIRNEIPDMFYSYTFKGKSWTTPKINPNYIVRLIDELTSGKYLLNEKIPLIKDMWNYPIRCTDINARTTIKSKDSNDDYDIANYVWDNRLH